MLKEFDTIYQFQFLHYVLQFVNQIIGKILLLIVFLITIY